MTLTLPTDGLTTRQLLEVLNELKESYHEFDKLVIGPVMPASDGVTHSLMILTMESRDLYEPARSRAEFRRAANAELLRVNGVMVKWFGAAALFMQCTPEDGGRATPYPSVTGNN